MVGIALKVKGLVGAFAPALSAPKVESVAIAVLVLLLPVPIGGAKAVPVFLIKPIEVSGKVPNVLPSNCGTQVSFTSASPAPAVRFTFQTAFTTNCFWAAVNGVPCNCPFNVMPSKTLAEKSLVVVGVTVTGK